MDDDWQENIIRIHEQNTNTISFVIVEELCTSQILAISSLVVQVWNFPLTK